MNEKLLQKSEWQVISNTCCLPLLCFVLLNSFPSMFSHCFQGLFVGSSKLEKQLCYWQCYYIIFCNVTSLEFRLSIVTDSWKMWQWVVRDLRRFPNLRTSVTLVEVQLRLFTSQTYWETSDLREEHQVINKPIHQRIWLLAHGGPQT